MKSKEILTIFALIFLGLCLLLNLGNKSSLQKWGDASVFIAVVLLAVGQLLGETEKFDWEIGVVNTQGEGQNYKDDAGDGKCPKSPCKLPKICNHSNGSCVTPAHCGTLKHVYKGCGDKGVCSPCESPASSDPSMKATWPCACTPGVDGDKECRTALNRSDAYCNKGD
jgi:hypothetical protein